MNEKTPDANGGTTGPDLSATTADPSIFLAQLIEAGIKVPTPVNPQDIDRYRIDGKNMFTYEDNEGVYRQASLGHLENILASMGIELPDDKYARRAEVERVVQILLRERTVDYCTPIAGCKAGLLKGSGGTKILVTHDSGWVDPCKGDWKSLQSFLQALLKDAWVHLMDWLALALDDFQRCREVGPYEANLRPHQSMIIIGPPGCGKSLLKYLITCLFGGRSADPFRYLIGDTRFNEEIIAAPLLVMDDSTASTSRRTRNSITQSLKNLQVIGEYRVEGKNQKVLHLRACQRVLILANEDSLDTLPLLPESFRDKAVLLEAFPSELVSNWDDVRNKELWVKSLVEGLPALACHLLNEHVIPDDRRDSRYGMKAFHSPHILALMEGQDDLGLVDLLVKYALASRNPPSSVPLPGRPLSPPCEWTGTARELHALILQRCQRDVVFGVLYTAQQLGLALASFVLQRPDEYVRGRHTHGNVKWSVKFDWDREEFEHARILCAAKDASFPGDP